MKALIPLLLLAVMAGCATTAQITRGSTDYISVGTVSEKLRGHDFYLAIGDVDLYRHNWVGKTVPTGHTAEAAVAVQVNGGTGQVQKLVTLQPAAGAPTDWMNAAAVAGSGPYAVGDLVGGVSVIDIQPHATWLETLQELQKATTTLQSSAANAAARRWYHTTVIVADPFPRPFFFFEFEHHRRWHH